MSQRGRRVESKAKEDKTMTQEHEAVHINTHTRTSKDTHTWLPAQACYFRQIPKKGDVLDEKENFTLTAMSHLIMTHPCIHICGYYPPYIFHFFTVGQPSPQTWNDQQLDIWCMYVHAFIHMTLGTGIYTHICTQTLSKVSLLPWFVWIFIIICQLSLNKQYG